MKKVNLFILFMVGLMIFIGQTNAFAQETITDLKAKINTLEETNIQLQQQLQALKEHSLSKKNDLYAEMQQLQHEMNQFFNDSI